MTSAAFGETVSTAVAGNFPDVRGIDTAAKTAPPPEPSLVFYSMISYLSSSQAFAATQLRLGTMRAQRGMVGECRLLRGFLYARWKRDADSTEHGSGGAPEIVT